MDEFKQKATETFKKAFDELTKNLCRAESPNELCMIIREMRELYAFQIGNGLR